MPAVCVDTYRSLCEKILEPVRAEFEKPVTITSGYRSPQANEFVHGVRNSQHQATASYCAADFVVPGEDMRSVFDWIRLESGLPFDQVILEHGASSYVIHVSWAKAYQRREALEGATNNRTAYAHLEVDPEKDNA